jgi:hypothetical protein
MVYAGNDLDFTSPLPVPSRTPASSSPGGIDCISSASCPGPAASLVVYRSAPGGLRANAVRPPRKLCEAPSVLRRWEERRGRPPGTNSQYPAPSRNRHNATCRAGSIGPEADGDQHRTPARCCFRGLGRPLVLLWLGVPDNAAPRLRVGGSLDAHTVS